MAYARYDLDILVTAYNVNAMKKNHHPLPSDADYDQAVSFIEQFVPNKLHFETVLVEAQRRRELSRAAEVKWFDRCVIQDCYDIYKWKHIEHSSSSED